MSTPPEPPPSLPAHLRPATVTVPRIWTAEQALAAFDMIDELRDAIWALHGDQIQDLLRAQCADNQEMKDSDIHDPGSN